MTPHHRRGHFLLISPNHLFSSSPKAALLLHKEAFYRAVPSTLLSDSLGNSLCPSEEATSKGSRRVSTPGQGAGELIRRGEKVQGTCGYTYRYLQVFWGKILCISYQFWKWIANILLNSGLYGMYSEGGNSDLPASILLWNRTIILPKVLQGDGSWEILHRNNSVKALGRNSADGFLNRQLNRVISKLTLVFIVIR